MKIFITLLVLGGLGFGVWYLLKGRTTPEQKMCTLLAEKCGKKLSTDKLKLCSEKMTTFRETVGEKPFDNALSCLEKTESCLGVAGCMVGANLGALGDFAQGVLEGMGPGLKDKGKQLIDKAGKLGGKILDKLNKEFDKAKED